MSGVLIDNFTLQGAYCFLEQGRAGKLFEMCLAHLIETVVLYDSVSVPLDVLERNDAAKQMASRFGGLIEGLRNYQLPDLNHHLVDRATVERLEPHIPESFWDYEDDADAFEIERTGMPPSVSFFPGYMGRGEPRLMFAQRHAYYTWFCVNLAAAFGVNYAPNPIREPLFAKPEVFGVSGPAKFEAEIMQNFESAQARYFAPLSKVLPLEDRLQLPLVYNAVRAKALRLQNIVDETIALRESKPARAFREHCTELQEAIQAHDFERARQTLAETQALSDEWGRSTSRLTQWKTIKLGLSFVASIGFDARLPSIIGDPAIKPHFVFVHQLLASTRRGNP